MNLANKITLIRIAMIPLFMLFMYLQPLRPGVMEIIAVLLFLAAAGTDRVDGYVARKYNQITKFGKIMDPVADKLLIAGVFITLADIHPQVSAWPVTIIMAREFLISALRMIAASEGVVISANIWGKVKTNIQVLVAFLLILHPGVIYLPGPTPFIIIWLTALFTIYSGLVYFWESDLEFFAPPEK